MKIDLDKLIRTWESMLNSGKLSKNFSDIILMTVVKLKELKDIESLPQKGGYK